jgi:hypothetical protein
MSRYLFAALLLVGSMAHLKAEQTLQDSYLLVYVEIHDADNLEKNKDYLGALAYFKAALTNLQLMHEMDADWQSTLINRIIKDCQDAIARLQPLAEKQVRESYGPIDSTESSLLLIKKDAFQLQNDRENGQALNLLEKYLTILEIIHVEYPSWESNLVEQRIKETQLQVDELQKAVFQEWKDSQGKTTVQ